MKISNGYFGIPKQLYHTSYTPLESSRASSLQPTPSFTHPLHPATRPEGNAPVIIMRDIPRNNLSGSQTSQQELKSKLVPHEYYSKSTGVEEIVAQLQIKMEELGKKVNKNTEDIKNLRHKDKGSNLETDIQKKFAEDL
jgi:phage protein D